MEKGIVTKASIDFYTSREIIEALLLDTSLYDKWLLGSSCTEITRINTMTDLIKMNFNHKRYWPLRPSLV